jgi:RHS repeat-associated protein
MKAPRDNVTGTYKGYSLSGITLVSPTVLNFSYYDDYAFMGTNGIPASADANFKYDAETGYDTRYTASAKTFLTGTLTARLEGSSTPSYLCSVMYYDNRGRVIQTKSQNHLSGGIEKEYVAYNFTGQPTGKKHVHSATGKTTQTELYTYAYDHAGRLTTVKHKLNTDSIVTLAENTYDELGRLKTNKKNGQSALTSSYAYNIRSWMKSVASPLFSQTLYYNDTYAGNTPRYNGNISAMSWSVSGENKTRGYNFTYDNLSRLTGAGYLENGNANDRFNTSYAYDKHGNMTLLSRRGNTGTTTYGLIDNLSMTYAGNQLVKTEDTGSSVTLSQSMDFKNNANLATEYLYDKNGNLIKDYNKSITEISYNVLNLPQTLKISSATNTYTYAADGRKLKTVLGGSKTTDYCGNVIYENGLLKRILVDGGYIENGIYYFYLTDHLGNNRVIASAGGSIVQSNHYYPFGMSFTEGSTTSQQPYKYNGKELDTERGLNLYDYSARYMDPALGRFSTVDPMAEKYYSISPYTYCANNPVRYVDLHGDSLTLVGSNLQEIVTAIYNGLADNTNISMKFNNGVLDPSSIQEQAKNTSDVFLQDIYEIATNPTMVELSVSDKNTYIMNGQKTTEEFASTPYDYDTRDESLDLQRRSIAWGLPVGRGINGNLGQTLIPGNVSKSGKSSTNNNVQVIINGKGKPNHITVGIAHEFGYVILYLRRLPYGHGQSGVDDFVYGRATIMSKRLGYDY